MPWLVALAFAASTLATGAARADAMTAATAAELATGQRIYRDGTLPSGDPLIGTAQAGVQRAGADAACATCHRRSGYGSSEGSLEVRAITGPALFGEREARAVAPTPDPNGPELAFADAAASAPRDAAVALRKARVAALYGHRPRPAYDEASLVRAIAEGIDVTGHRMSDAMPRYTLADRDMAALVAYLKTLSSTVPAGVTAHSVHFATVILPRVEPTKRSAMLDVLRTYFDDRNAGVRAEIRRDSIGNVRLGRTSREWVLHVWDLIGPEDTWPQQLEAHYREQPVFGLVGGIASGSWRAVHDFSERFEVPCILPQTDLPVVDPAGFYTVYLSQGIVLEAKALARFLEHQREGATRVVQVFRPGEPRSAAAATALHRALRVVDGFSIEDRVLDGNASGEFWRRLARDAAGATLVLWLDAADLAQARAFVDSRSEHEPVYVSWALGGKAAVDSFGERPLRMIYPEDTPSLREARVRPIKSWLHSKGIALVDETVQMNAYLAAFVVTGVMSHSMDVFSREFLLERIEHRMGNAVEPTLYPRVSLGPGQRFASKGSYIAAVTGAGPHELRALSHWIVP